MSQLTAFLAHRFGWETYLRPFLYKKLPSGVGWSATLGSLCALTFAVEAVTGMVLAMYYTPSPDLAYRSIQYIMEDVQLGWLLRGIHHWGAGAMVFLVACHLLHVFFTGSFKAPREMTWVVGTMLLLLTLGMGFTGYLLPWDQKAYWATVVSSNVPRDIPIIGDVVTRVLLGGDRVSGLTLSRFYATHMLILPTLMLTSAAVHIYLVRLHGMAADSQSDSTSGRIYRFYPEHLARASTAFALVLAALAGLSALGHVPLEKMAGTVDPAYLPRPEWYYMWLFQLLTYFSGRWEAVGSLAIPLAGVAMLFAVPWLGRWPLRRLADRPLAAACGVSGVVAVVYLTVTAFSGVQPYGQVVPIPDRALTPVELRGLEVYVERECAYCHNISNQGGRREGPDLANMAAKKRTVDAMMEFIKNPQKVSSLSIMPKYDLPPEQLQGLAEFILSLNPGQGRHRIATAEDVRAGKIQQRTGAISAPEGIKPHPIIKGGNR
ncbi:MAG: cytochrome b N-terminal domain-containing protein [Deltaproteobacteria bacterium]|nr:cytochrome b N-terminal domain-containing protein [Deltaproteobacteria bacterium]